jgi:hypothetical protein
MYRNRYGNGTENGTTRVNTYPLALGARWHDARNQRREIVLSLAPCRECGKEISTSARACPHCGSPVKRVKWWLWVPLGLLVAIVGFVALQPSRGDAADVRDACRKMGGTFEQCERVYQDRIKQGSGCPPEAPGCSWGKR